MNRMVLEYKLDNVTKEHLLELNINEKTKEKINDAVKGKFVEGVYDEV